MKLYHGTKMSVLKEALKTGLLPRLESGVDSEWETTVASSEHMVYLTNAYPVHFALSASSNDDPAIVIEVEVDPSLLVPDEDFLEQATRKDSDFLKLIADAGYHSDTMEGRTEYFRDNILEYASPHYTDASLSRLGTVGHIARIPPEAILRAVTVEPRTALILDPTITLMNCMIMGGFYRRSVPWLFGDPVPEGNKESPFADGGFPDRSAFASDLCLDTLRGELA